jgi:hypothetical protein
VKNPIRIGDDAFAIGEHGVISDVRGDHVLLNGEWRHWGNCMYGARVVERIVLSHEQRDVGVMAAQLAALERLVGPLDGPEPPFIPLSEPLSEEVIASLLNNEDD